MVFIDVIERYLGIKEPCIPKETDYGKVAEYLVASQKASIAYNRIVLAIGILGLILSVILLIILVGCNEWDWDCIYRVKQYPAMIASLVTISFAYLEMEEKKKELYTQLQNISSNFKNDSDKQLIAEDYKKWTWSEFQNKLDTK